MRSCSLTLRANIREGQAQPIDLGLRLQDQFHHVDPLNHQPGVARSPAEISGHVVESFPQIHQSGFQRLDSLGDVHLIVVQFAGLPTIRHQSRPNSLNSSIVISHMAAPRSPV